MEGKVSEKQERLNKLSELKKLGINPYPSRAERSHRVADVLFNFEDLEKGQKDVAIDGRIRSLRGHGNLTFAHLDDGSGRLQIVVSKNDIGVEQYKIFSKLIDLGDFIEICGKAFTTQKGEKSIKASGWRLLAKSLNPLPDKWHGLADEEDRLRKRYLDLMFNPDIKDLFHKRSKFWQSMRDFLLAEGFLEVETPVLENTTGGADARPFITHHNALDIDVFLRISMGELWQKRLMVAGFEKTFEIGRQFRNEGISAEHAQDYTQMEFYWAYADYSDGMKLIERLYKHLAMETFGKLKFTIGTFEVDLGQAWSTYDFGKIIKEKTGVDILAADLKEIEAVLKKLKIEYDTKGFNLTRGIDNLWKYCRKQIGGPGFLVNVPVVMEPLAKRKADNPGLVERFQVIIAGSEIGKGYSELNDPLDQAERFESQQKLRDAGDDEAQMFDVDFIEALEYGMPPTCGFGVSERLFAFLAGKSVRECQLFPLMRPKSRNA
jgi:lysyl-tRNA synthetase class 2